MTKTSAPYQTTSSNINCINKKRAVLSTGEIYDSPLSEPKVISIQHFSDLHEHPFLAELTANQVFEIGRYIKDSGFDVIELQSNARIEK